MVIFFFFFLKIRIYIIKEQLAARWDKADKAEMYIAYKLVLPSITDIEKIITKFYKNY